MSGVVLKAFDWTIDDRNDETVFYCFGHNEQNKTVAVKIVGFTPYMFIELPPNKGWNKSKAKALFEHLKFKMKDDAPISYTYEVKKMFRMRKLAKVMRVMFKTHNHCRHASNILRYSQTVNSQRYPPNYFKIHEQDIEPLIKFFTLRKIVPSGWIEISDVVEDEDGDEVFSTTDEEYTCQWTDVHPAEVDDGIRPRLKIASFDLETYSQNHNSKAPDPSNPENEVFQISFHTGILGDLTSVKKVLLSLYECPDIDGTEVRVFSTESELLLGFQRIMLETDPDILLTYNGMKFDWNYLIERVKLIEEIHPGFGSQFYKLGRLDGIRTPVVSKVWKSSAYGDQVFSFLSPQGRVNIDVMIEIERNYKLDTFSLNNVAQVFLKETKEDVSHKQLFKLVEIYKELHLCHNVQEARTRLTQIVDIGDIKGVVKDTIRGILRSSDEKLSDAVRKGIWWIGVYCVQDSVLPIKLEQHHSMFVGLEQMSNIFGVPISYFQTRGQQIKVIAQIYRKTVFENYVVNNKIYNVGGLTTYEGAFVVEAHPGYYENVVIEDFGALYPSIMISENLCHTTQVSDDDPIPDSECHVIEWDSHRFCEHDRLGRKGPKDKLICGHFRYRFLKQRYNADGTIDNEGILPNLLRNILKQRKAAKKEMAKYQLMLYMNEHELNDDEEAFRKKIGLEKISIGSLSSELVFKYNAKVSVLNARQLALKVSANSVYGSTGAPTGFVPLLEVAACTTAVGRKWILASVDYILRNYPSSKLVYGDTDSCMMQFAGANVKESWQFGKDVEKRVTHYLKCVEIGVAEDAVLTPEQQLIYDNLYIVLEFENLYGQYLLLTKKRYVAYSFNISGEIIGKTHKGIVAKRRDNCIYVRNVYMEIVNMIFKNMTKLEIMREAYDMMHALMKRQVPTRKLTIFVGVKTIFTYKEVQKALFEIRARGETGSDHELLIQHADYFAAKSKLLQVLLMIKMLRRGDEVPPNTRLEYILLRNDSGLQGDKAEEYIYYRDNKERYGMEIDFLLYLEKKFNQVEELLTTRFKPREILAMPLDKKIDEEILKLVKNKDPYIDAVARQNRVDKRVSIVLERDEIVMEHGEEKFKCKAGAYKLGGEEYTALRNACLWWKSEKVIKNMYSRYGMSYVNKVLRFKKGEASTLRIVDAHPVKSTWIAHRNYCQVVKHLDEMFRSRCVELIGGEE